MWYHVIACDYDGTLATDGRIAPETLAALGRVRHAGRRVVLITGRRFDDLLVVCPEHAFLRLAGFAVAVGNAIPSLIAEADLVTRAANGAGVREFVDSWLLAGQEPFRPRSIAVGVEDDGTPVTLPVRGPNLLVTGASGSGKSTLAGVFVERLVHDKYVVCLLDPEGDYRPLAEQAGIVVLASEPGTEANRAEEIGRLLRHRSTSVAIDLSSLDRSERVRAAARFLHAVQRLRAETGAPHWVLIDEAHHL